MTFSPRMDSAIRGFSVVGEFNWRVWNGVVADVWDVRCTDDARGDYVSPDPRLFVTLELDTGAFLMGDTENCRTGRHDRPMAMSYVPAHMPVRGWASGLRRMKHLDLHFTEASLLQRFGRSLDRKRLAEPRFAFHESRIAALAVAIAAECENREPLHDLYGDGLINALFALLFDIEQEQGRARAALSRQQLRLVTNYVEAHCLEPIRLSDLSGLVGLSDSHFSHAFKASTGMPPHRWHMQVRIRRVQDMLEARHGSLTEIAALTGFADQAHLSRVFKMFVGVTPTGWMRSLARQTS